ncbi:hypothetical protein SteCoe_37604 [Stentor coeruleus]|uniref:Uncharacterized protein n=1 Tax=Stentor coeruleus TaxID=5963 RepID=A0A1R2AMT3_9CILI|nr:hypothetical protein SteCoe_37604 [Stentor coeruleus]
METMDIFNDVLTTDRRQSQDIISGKPVIESDNALNFSKMSFFMNPTYSVAGDSKPYTVSSQYIQKKKAQQRKPSYIMELTELLALAEIRYLDNTNKLKEAIVSNRKFYTMRIVHFIRLVYPLIKRLQVLIAKTYWYKWISTHRESNLNRPISKAFILWSFSLLWKKINKRNKMRALISFKERGIIYQFGIQYYGIDSISKKKLSKFLPPFKKEENNKTKLEKIASSKTPAGISLKILKEDKKERYYFK